MARNKHTAMAAQCSLLSCYVRSVAARLWKNFELVLCLLIRISTSQPNQADQIGKHTARTAARFVALKPSWVAPIYRLSSSKRCSSNNISNDTPAMYLKIYILFVMPDATLRPAVSPQRAAFFRRDGRDPDVAMDDGSTYEHKRNDTLPFVD